MATTSSSTKVMLPKLQEDGSNWVMYKEWIVNHLTSKGLLHHLSGTARKPIEVEEKNGKVHKKGNATAMTDAEFEAYLDSLDMYAQKEAQVREVLYDTLTKTVTLQIRGQPTAADSWKKLTSIFESKGDMTITDTLSKLTSTHYVDGNDMRAHVATLLELRNDLPKWDTRYPTNNSRHTFAHPSHLITDHYSLPLPPHRKQQIKFSPRMC
jgi:hypothetical protein